MRMGDPLSVLLDLSVLSTPTLSRGMGRYISSLAGELHCRSLAEPSLRVSAISERPLLREPFVTADIPALLEELAERRRSAGSAWSAPRGGRRVLIRSIQKAQADIVHSLDPHATPFASLPCPRVLTCHHLDSDADASLWHGASAEVLRADKIRFGGADRIIASSRATAQELIARLDVPRAKISIVHHGVSLKKWSADVLDEGPMRRAAMGITSRRYLLCVGAVDERKNVEGVLQGLSRAQKLMGGEELRLVWVGHLDKLEEQKLRTLSEQAGLEDAVIRTGYISDADLAALYSGATALIFASKREGFGYPIVEAMASGCPVITSNRSSLAEVAARAALTVNPHDAHAIADSIVLLADDDAERTRMTIAGKNRASSFSLQRMIDGTLNAYLLALGRRQARISDPPSP